MTGPKVYRGIMVSSTFADLEEHRRDLIRAIEMLGFRANVMEISGAQADTDVIDTSIKMVRDSAAFIGVISHRYGQTPKCPDRNPDALSISELEFNEAMRLGRPILLFIMGDRHPLTIADFESVQEKKVKLDAFRERAKQMREGSTVERIYEVFSSREEFTRAAITAAGKLSQSLQPRDEVRDGPDASVAPPDSIETAGPPDLRAVPRYFGSHGFVGRAAELSTLDDWCAAADQHPMLLFEAIGGSGKSMVTWTWLTGRAMEARSDWAGRFWFSFYEGGATMTRFCQEALAYMTGQPVKAFSKEKLRTLMPRLVAELEVRPWLIVLDGLERILVAYHRIDASQMRDEDVETAEDQISRRDLRATINPEDEELLRLLTAAAPSKLLVTSRLTPQALINRSGMAMPGVRREMLAGLRPADAESLLRACGVSGNSKAMQEYVQRNCDCHPLVIGALAGLINTYMPDRGNFDAWLGDPQAGGRLGLGDLDLIQRRNHILDTAIDALPEPGRKVLQTLSLLQGGADYATLKEFNPHLPLRPVEVKEPSPPEQRISWRRMNEEEKESAKARFDDVKKAHAAYAEALKAWEQSPEVLASAARFDETLTELERRGLLQYEHSLKQYDLHPVVRGVAAGRMGEAETGDIGGRVVDHFSSRPHAPWKQSETLEDLALGIQVVATLTLMGRLEDAFKAYDGELGEALWINLMAVGEIQRLLRPFFPQGWDGPIALKRDVDQSDLLGSLASTFFDNDNAMCIRLSDRAIRMAISSGYASVIRNNLRGISAVLGIHGKLSEAIRLKALSLEFADAAENEYSIYHSLLSAFWGESYCGAFERVDALWSRLDPQERDWGDAYTCGEAERAWANDLFWRGKLTEAVLAETERLCRVSRDRFELIQCLHLRGDWHLSNDEPGVAIAPLGEALHLCRSSGVENPSLDVMHALARLRSGQPEDAHNVAERLDEDQHYRTALFVAELWQDLGEPTRAIAAALRAHSSACGSGEPYVYRYYLDRADALLRKLGETPPEVPKHNPANDEVFDWEDDVRALIVKTRTEREDRERRKTESEQKSSLE